MAEDMQTQQQIALIRKRIEHANAELEQKLQECTAIQQSIMRAIKERARQAHIQQVRSQIQSLSSHV